MEIAVRNLFDRYGRFFNRALHREVDAGEAASFYTAAFIAASPAGVMTGNNDDQFGQAMEQGYIRYRATGMKEVRMRYLPLSTMDEHHCVAHVAWTAVYAKLDMPDLSIDFDVHYFVQKLGCEPRIFGWVSGDEQALLKQYGIV